MLSKKANGLLRFIGSVCLAYILLFPLALLAAGPYEQLLAGLWKMSGEWELLLAAKNAPSVHLRKGVLAANISLTVLLVALSPAAGSCQRLLRTVSGLALLFLLDLFVISGLISREGSPGAEAILVTLSRSGPILIWAVLCGFQGPFLMRALEARSQLYPSGPKSDAFSLMAIASGLNWRYKPRRIRFNRTPRIS